MEQICIDGMGDNKDYAFEVNTSDKGPANSNEQARTMHGDIYGIYEDDVSNRDLDDDLTWLYAPEAPIGTYVERSPTPCRLEPIVVGEPLAPPPRFE